MHYPVTTLDQKKTYLKLRARRMFFRVIESAIFWFAIGFVCSSISGTYVMVKTFEQLNKIIVCN